jgi:hypothetical protein
MTPRSAGPDLLRVARRVVWFKPPEEAVEVPRHFLAYAMTYGTDEDIVVVRRYFSDADLKDVLADPAPGVFDAKSWAYWNLVLGRSPPPPLPVRRIRGEEAAGHPSSPGGPRRW